MPPLLRYVTTAVQKGPPTFHSFVVVVKVDLSGMTGLMKEALRHAVPDKILMVEAAKKVSLKETCCKPCKTRFLHSLVGGSCCVCLHQLPPYPGANQGRCVSRAHVLYKVEILPDGILLSYSRSIANLCR